MIAPDTLTILWHAASHIQDNIAHAAPAWAEERPSRIYQLCA